MARVKRTVYLAEDLSALLDRWSGEWERSPSWVVERALTRMAWGLSGRNVSQPVEVVEVPRGTDPAHRHRYVKVDGTQVYEKGQPTFLYRCACGDEKRDR